jgi:membrane-bound ClpP family serine protease
MDPSAGYLLITLGVVLLLAELVLFTGGILAGLGVCLVFVGVACVFAFGSADSGLTAVFGVCIGGPILAAVFFYLWPYSPMSRKLRRAAEDHITVAEMAGNAELEDLRGKTGRALSSLRPSGTADFDGRRVDVITQGMMVDAGEFVRCVEVRGSRVVVRPAEKPPAHGLDTAEFS